MYFQRAKKNMQGNFLHRICFSDSGNNGDIEYSWVPTSSQYYSLNSNGAILLKVDPTVYLTYGDTYRFIATATDQGSPRLSSSVTIDVVYRVSTVDGSYPWGAT